MADSDALHEQPIAEPWCIIAGGGTAGHVLPGLVIADELVARGHDRSSIHFVGSARGLEADLVPASGYEITLLPGRGLTRKLSLETIRSAFAILRAVFSAIGLMRRHRPAVVLTLGGYASVPCGVAAVLWRVPLVVAEQNARAGLANRLVGRFAKACAVPFAATDLPHATVTGNPVRPAVLAAAALDPLEARKRLDIPQDRMVLAVVSGSLGARSINTTLVEVLKGWQDRADLAVYHVLGARDFAALEPFEPTGSLWYRRVEYESDVPTLLAACDALLARAGGTTVAELSIVGRAAVLVPLPIATRDHQTANAAELVESGAAELIRDADLDTSTLTVALQGLFASRDELERRGRAAASTGHPDAAAAVAALIERAAESRGRR